MKRLRNSGGEIVEVNGGHIVRSINRKDRHSKVCTSKGPRDRRLRLSATTAIQFYDVQDRLGYDRPSNAIDWLLLKAKSAIDELEELPPWKPTTGISNSSSRLNFDDNPDEEITNNEMGNDQNSIFLPQSLDSIKSFFPMGGSSTPVNGDSPAMQLHRSFLRPENLRLRLAGDHGGLGWPESVDSVSGGFEFSSQATQTTPFQHMLFSQTTNKNHFFNDSNSQRGSLQSSNTPSIRAWNDQPPFTGAAIDHTGFPSGIGGFSGLFYPAQTQGEHDENDGLSDKPSSVSSDSRQ